MINAQLKIIMCCIINVLNFNNFDNEKFSEFSCSFSKISLTLVKSSKYDLKN